MLARKHNTITAIHRTRSYSGPANGLGCYIQSCEERLMDAEKYRTFIENMLTPLLQSNVQAIIINIDPLYKDSNITRLTEVANGFFKVDKRISVIVPEQHVNAAVGRNITFNVIRQIDYDKHHTYPNIPKHLLWYGMDDDDMVITDGINDLCEVIHSDDVNISSIITVNKQLNSAWRDSEDTPVSHYAQWCYAFSPSYYNGLSYPCTPLEKEDLDVFNRLFQYPAHFITIDECSSIIGHEFREPYKYMGTNPNRPRGDALYNTIDVIQYLNAHHSAETKDMTLNSPSATAHKRGYKRYYMNDAKRYYLYYPLMEAKYSVNYGIPLHYNSDTYKDIGTNGPRDTLNYLLEHPKDDATRTMLQRENFNGDLYMVRYTICSQDRTLYGVSFQNGKDPSNIVLDVRNKRLKQQLQISKTVADNIKTVFGTVILFMLHDKREFIDDSLIERWNAIVLSERSTGKYIPLKTFGGRYKFTDYISWVMLIAFALTVLVIIIIIVCVKNMKTKASIDPYRCFP